MPELVPHDNSFHEEVEVLDSEGDLMPISKSVDEFMDVLFRDFSHLDSSFIEVLHKSSTDLPLFLPEHHGEDDPLMCALDDNFNN